MPKATSVVEPAEVGEHFHSNAGDDGQDWIIAEPCDNKTNGRWICVTHDKVFQHNFEKDCHIHRGKHRLAWLCLSCGEVEKP